MRRKISIILFITFCLPLEAAIIYVDADAASGKNGGTWATAFQSLSTAITNASPGDEIWVAEGTYGSIALKNGVRVYGGFAGNENSARRSNPDVHRTIISGGGTTRAIKSIDSDSSTILRGVVIKDGAALEPHQAGGGLYLKNSKAIFVQCVFTNNTSKFAGGAVANYSGGSPTFLNCHFQNNGSANNVEAIGGGAVFNHDGTPVFVNCLFTENRAGDGGAIVSLSGAIELTNCTFSNNEATKRRGGAIFDNRGEALIRNCILWNNHAIVEAKEIYNNRSIGFTTNVQYSNVQGGWSGSGNLNADPLFVDVTRGNFRLQNNSPCIDAGLDAFLLPDSADINMNGNTNEHVPHDLALQQRIYGTSVDMGAFERIP